jgi:hypothetical protein
LDLLADLLISTFMLTTHPSELMEVDLTPCYFAVQFLNQEVEPFAQLAASRQQASISSPRVDDSRAFFSHVDPIANAVASAIARS